MYRYGGRILTAAASPARSGTRDSTPSGTPNLVKSINAMGGLGFFNNRMECSPDAEQVGAERCREEFRQQDTTSNKCSVACGKTFDVKKDEYAGTAERLAALGLHAAVTSGTV